MIPAREETHQRSTSTSTSIGIGIGIGIGTSIGLYDDVTSPPMVNARIIHQPAFLARISPCRGRDAPPLHSPRQSLHVAIPNFFTQTPTDAPHALAVWNAARLERERVRAALKMWKLHTERRAFLALAAHRQRRCGSHQSWSRSLLCVMCLALFLSFCLRTDFTGHQCMSYSSRA